MRLSAAPNATSAAPYALRGAILARGQILVHADHRWQMRLRRYDAALIALSAPVPPPAVCRSRIPPVRALAAAGQRDFQLIADFDVGHAEVFGGLIQLAKDHGQMVFFDRRAMLAHSLLFDRAPPLHRARNDGQRAVAVLDDVQFLKRLGNLQRVVAVDDADDEAVCLALLGNPLKTLLRAHPVALGQFVAVEDRDDVREGVIDDEIGGFPDLPLARFAVADDAIDVAVQPVHACRRPQARGHAQPLPERARRGIREGKTRLRMRMPVDRAVDGAKRHRIGARHRAARRAIVRFPDRRDEPTQVGVRRVENRDSVPLGKHQPVGGTVPRVFRVPPHLVIHEHCNHVSQRQRRRRMPAPGGGGHLDRQFPDFNGFLVHGSAAKLMRGSES